MKEQVGHFLIFSDNNGNTALHLAAIFNRESIAQKLLAAGASLKINNEAGDFPVDLATTNTMKILLRIPPEIQSEQNTNLEVSENSDGVDRTGQSENRGDHVIQFLPEEIREMSDQFSEEKNLLKQMEMLWFIVVAFLSHFWREYRAFLYIGKFLCEFFSVNFFRAFFFPNFFSGNFFR